MNSWWGLLVQLAVASYLSWRMQRKARQQRPEATKFSDFSGPTNNNGRAIPKGFGRFKLPSPHLIWWGNYRTQAFEKKERTKLYGINVGSTKAFVGWGYYVSMALGLVLGGGVRLREVWANDKKVWEGNVASGGVAAVDATWGENQDGGQKDGLKGDFRFYSGNATRDPHLVAMLGADVPAYKHLSYVVFEAPTTDLGATGIDGQSKGWVGMGGSVPALAFVLQYLPSLAATGLAADARFAASSDIGGDANPAYVVAELCTSRLCGAGLDAADLDSQSFHDAAAVLKAEGNGCGFFFDSAKGADDLVQELLRQANAVLQPDPDTGRLRMRLIRATDTPLFDLDESNIVELEDLNFTALDDATNEVIVPFLDPADWKEKQVICQDLGAIAAAGGLVISETVDFAGPRSKDLAGTLGTRELQTNSQPLGRCRVQTNDPRAKRCMPGDLLRLSWSREGITHMGVRVLGVNLPKAHRQQVSLDLVQDVFTNGRAIYSAPAAVGSAVSVAPPNAASWQMVLAGMPYGLTRVDANRALVLAGAPAVQPENAKGFRTVMWSGQAPNTSLPATDAEWLMGQDRGFAAKGATSSAIAATGLAGAMFNLTLSGAGDAYTVSKNAGKDVVLVVGQNPPEFILASLTPGSGNAATATIKKRGCFGSVPFDYAAGAPVVAIYDAAVDEQELQAAFSEQYQCTLLTVPVHARALAYGAGGQRSIGTPATGNRGTMWAASGSAWDNVDALRYLAGAPYCPGDLKLGGKAWTMNTTDARGLGQDIGQAAFATLQWKHRNRFAIDANGSVSDWTSGDFTREEGVSYRVSASYRTATGAWKFWHTGDTIDNWLILPDLPADAIGPLDISITVSTAKAGAFLDGTYVLEARWTGTGH